MDTSDLTSATYVSWNPAGWTETGTENLDFSQWYLAHQPSGQ